MKRLPVFLLFCSAVWPTRGLLAADSLPKVSVVVSPALFVPVAVAVQGGLQFAIGRRWALLVEGAWPVFEPDHEAYDNVSFWRAGAELKCYFSRGRGRPYVALQGRYLYRELERRNPALYYTESQTFSYNQAKIQSPVYVAGLKAGTELAAGRRLFVDLFAAAGLRVIATTYKTESAVLTSLLPEKQTFFRYDDAWLYNYTLHRPYLSAGVRLGIRL